MSHPGQALVIIGMVCVLLGLLWMGLPYVPWLGRLPGDLRIEGKNGSFYFPIATCLLLSVLLSFATWIIHWLRR